ncbi:dynein axonemal assembly factor 5 [Phymastichus coffea]|uniref:dynein axonemal assembly factor 5 n=1 Tax=Phymastichus coffea TaxID=108790 RepID=UPI00273C261C|nr:dynein axonemal assembly factor 5 [Phymastichus coffea]
MPESSDAQYTQICASLQSEDKFKRKQALREILKDILSSVDSLDEKRLLELWEIFHRPVVRVLHDPAEACRDSSLEILKVFLMRLPCSDKNIVYIIPILSKRLGSQELIEQSEEVRLKCVQLLRAVVLKYQDKLTSYFDDLVKILTRTVTDKYPNVKKESCDCISEMAKVIAADFYAKSEVFVKPVLTNIAHQHHRIRVTTVTTIGEILLAGNSKSMEIAAGPLAERLFDQSATVRTAVVNVAGRWMVDLKDRYSWWHKLLPLLLTGMNDVLPEIREKASALWIAAGEQYITENESDKRFKDKLDFFDDDPKHYPPNVERPNLGCRTLVQQNFSKLLGAIIRELSDWMADIKVRAAQLLCVLALNLEGEVNQHIQKLMTPMYRACNDEDDRVAENVELAAEYMAYFVPPNSYFELILPALQENPTRGHFRVFIAFLKGSQRQLLAAELSKVGKFLRESSVGQSRRARYQIQVLIYCRTLLQICREDCSDISQDLFTTIFTILSMPGDLHVVVTAKELLELLAKADTFENVNQLYEKHITAILLSIRNNCETWTTSSSEFSIFQACITHARTATYKNLDLIHPIFEKATYFDADKRLQLKQYILLSDYLQQWDDPCDDKNADAFINFANTILEKVIVPGLSWTAGRSAEAIRTASVCCLCALLNKIIVKCDKDNGKRFAISAEHFGWLFEQVRPVLVNLLEDDAFKTRLYTLQAICFVMNIGQELSYINEEHIHKTSSEILSRLEDSNDQVRLAAIEAVREIWKILPKDYDLSFYYVHIDYVYTNMLTHLDDPKEKFQKLILECLMDLVKIHPMLLLEKIEKSRPNFINQKSLDQLSAAAQDHLKNK